MTVISYYLGGIMGKREGQEAAVIGWLVTLVDQSPRPLHPTQDPPLRTPSPPFGRSQPQHHDAWLARLDGQGGPSSLGVSSEALLPGRSSPGRAPAPTVPRP